MLGLDPGEAEEEVEVVVAEAIEEAGVPAEESHREGVTDVVVVVTKGTLTVFLGLTLEDGGESEEKDRAAVNGEEEREVEAGVELEGVVFGGVVGKGRGGGEGRVTVRERRRKEVGFDGVEVVAAGVDAEGPGGEAGGLLGG